MAVDTLIQGCLHGDPVQRTTKTARPYATARLAVTDASGEQHLVSLIGFESQAVEALLAVGDGEALAVAGELSLGTCTTKGSDVRPALRLTVHQVLTPYHARRRREAGQDASVREASVVRSHAQASQRYWSCPVLTDTLP